MTTSPIRAALCAATALLCVTAAHALEPGQLAPAFNLPGATAPVSLSALKGKVVYVDFWASWCGPCKQSFPWMNEMQAKYGSKGFEVVAINLDAKTTDATAFLAETPARFAIAYDSKGESPKRYEIKGMPSSVLVGPDGKVLSVHAGFRADERKALEDAIVAALGPAR